MIVFFVLSIIVLYILCNKKEYMSSELESMLREGDITNKPFTIHEEFSKITSDENILKQVIELASSGKRNELIKIFDSIK